MNLFITTVSPGEKGRTSKIPTPSGLDLDVVVRRMAEESGLERIEARNLYGDLLAHWPRAGLTVKRVLPVSTPAGCS